MPAPRPHAKITSAGLFCSTSAAARVWLVGLPFITRSTFVVCVTLSLFTALTGLPDSSAVCLHGQAVLHGQVYRVLTSALAHGSLLHLVMNMMALLPMGAALERQLGSLQLLWLMILICVLGDFLYMLLAAASLYVPFSLPAIFKFWSQCAVGLSGVLFGLLLIDAHSGGAPTRSIFGMFSVSVAVYPYALLAVWQLLVPHASLLGHLSGLAVGQAYVMGLLRWALPSSATYAVVERSLCTACMASPSFIAHTGDSRGDFVLPTSTRQHPGGDSMPHSGWLSFLRTSERLRGLGLSGVGHSGLLGGSQAAQQPQQQQQQPQQAVEIPQQGARLGGRQQQTDATQAAAAAAAEARASRGDPAGAGVEGILHLHWRSTVLHLQLRARDVPVLRHTLLCERS